MKLNQTSGVFSVHQLINGQHEVYRLSPPFTKNHNNITPGDNSPTQLNSHSILPNNEHRQSSIQKTSMGKLEKNNELYIEKLKRRIGRPGVLYQQAFAQ